MTQYAVYKNAETGEAFFNSNSFAKRGVGEIVNGCEVILLCAQDEAEREVARINATLPKVTFEGLLDIASRSR